MNLVTVLMSILKMMCGTFVESILKMNVDVDFKIILLNDLKNNFVN